MRNFLLKVLSVALAIMFWLTIVITTQNITEFKSDIPVTMVNLAENQKLVTKLPSIKIKIDAPSDVLTELNPSDFKAIVDCKGLSNGEFEKEINVSVQNNKARIVSYHPRTFIFSLEWSFSKKVPVRLVLNGAIDGNYKISKQELSNNEIEINWTTSTIKMIDEVVVGLILQWENQDIIKKLTPKAYDKSGNILDVGFSPSTVTLNIKLDQILMTKTVWVTANLEWKLPNNLYIKSIRLDPEFIIINGDKNLLRTIDNLSTSGIDLSSATAWVKTYNRDIIIPSKIQWSRDKARIVVNIDNITN